jgi:hypothetical protein
MWNFFSQVAKLPARAVIISGEARFFWRTGKATNLVTPNTDCELRKVLLLIAFAAVYRLVFTQIT